MTRLRNIPDEVGIVRNSLMLQINGATEPEPVLTNRALSIAAEPRGPYTELWLIFSSHTLHLH